MKTILHKGFVANPLGTAQITLNGKTYKGEWVNGYYFQHRNQVTKKCAQDLHYIIPYPSTNEIRFAEVLPETIGIYIEKTDKNFYQIFEGDLIKNIKTNQLYEVVWDDYNLQFFFVQGNDRRTFDDFNENEYRVVGNKFESVEVAE